MPSPSHRALMLDTLIRFCILLRSIDAHYRSVERRSGLGGAQLWALSEVAAGPLTMGQLAQAMAIHLSTASNLVTRLESLGLVERQRDQADQRVVRLAATPAGRRKLRSAPRPSAGLLQEALLRMPDRNLRELRCTLDNVLDLMGLVNPKAARAIPIANLLKKAEQRTDRSRVSRRSGARSSR